MALIRLAPGAQLEALDERWVAYSELSGETTQLNTEAAVILELLAERDMDHTEIRAVLAEDTGSSPAEINEALRGIWGQLLKAGLIEFDPAHNFG